MNIHGHCYVLPLAAVGASTTPIPHHPSALPQNTNLSQVNNAQLATQMSCGINQFSMGNNGTGAHANNVGCNSTLQGANYPSLSHDTPTKYMVGAQNILPHLLQDQQTHLRQAHHPIIQLNPNHHQLGHTLHLQQPHQQSLLSIPYQTNNLQTATLTSSFNPFFATPSLPRSTSNLSNLSNFSSQHHSPKNVQQLGQVSASGHQHLDHHNLQNCTQHAAAHSDSQHHHHHSHQQIQDQLILRHQLHNLSSQPALQASTEPQIYNPFLNSASILSASSITPKAPLLQTPPIGKVGESILLSFYIYELEYHLSFLLSSFSLSLSLSLSLTYQLLMIAW